MKPLSLSFLYESIIDKQKTNGSMIAHFIPYDVAKQLRKLGDGHPGDRPNVKDMHITLGLLRDEGKKSKEIKNCLRLLSGFVDPYDISINKFELFPGHEENDFHDVLVARPESEQFEKIHSLLFDIFNKFKIPIDNGNFEFKPHITIKYLKPGHNLNLDKLKFDGKANIDSISFAKNGKVKHFILGER